MFIAKVIGNVVSTQKNEKFRGMKLLLIQPYISKDGKLQISGSSVVAVDSVGAGVGECVLFTQGSSARLTPTTKDAPVDAVIVGIVDAVEVEGKIIGEAINADSGAGDRGDRKGSSGRLRVQMQQPQAPAAPAASAARNTAPHDGVFSTVDEAVNAAFEAQKQVAAMSLEERGRMIDIIRRICMDRREELGRMELEETKVGRLDHKISEADEHALCARRGSDAQRGAQRSHRLVHHRARALGRDRHDAAGDAFGAHHGLQRHQHSGRGQHRGLRAAPLGREGGAIRAAAVQSRDRAGAAAWPNVLTTTREPSIEAAEQIFNHPKIALLCVTGGAAVARAAAKSGKRVIAGGPGNPPVVVDETADLDRAAKCIIEGAAFDNNLLCIGEKEIFVVASVADKFIAAMRRAGAFQLDRGGDRKTHQRRIHL